LSIGLGIAIERGSDIGEQAIVKTFGYMRAGNGNQVGVERQFPFVSQESRLGIDRFTGVYGAAMVRQKMAGALVPETLKRRS